MPNVFLEDDDELKKKKNDEDEELDDEKDEDEKDDDDDDRSGASGADNRPQRCTATGEGLRRRREPRQHARPVPGPAHRRVHHEPDADARRRDHRLPRLRP